MIVVVLALCVISAGVFMVYKNHQDKLASERDANFYNLAIGAFWENKVLFEQVKEHFLTLPDNITLLTVFCDRDNDQVVLPYQDFKISEDFENSLLSLANELEPMQIHVFFSVYDAMNIEKNIIEFHLNNGIMRKGITYVMNNDAEEYRYKNGLAKCQHLEGNWYYYEELPGV
jgi:hypothetical protein